jgi:3-oxoacyl-[acyl-carrier-protein] synthase II
MISPTIITGTGLITALGETAAQTWESLLAGGSIRDHARVPGISGDDRCGQLAKIAAEQAVRNAGWSREILSNDRTALVVATSKGPIESWLRGNVQLCGLGQIAVEIATDLGMNVSPCLTLSAACATGLHGLIRASLGLMAGEFDRALVVAAEASVHPLFIGSFQRLGVLPPEGHGCRPFDRQRRGFLLSEAAAALCLQQNGKPIVKVDRFFMGGDGAHLTAGDPNGQTLRRAIATAYDARRVDFVHAHGTGTLLHDPVELAALETTLRPGDDPLVYSHKAALGHSLGAAGLVSIVLNCLIHQTGMVPPNINTADPLKSSLKISQRVEHKSVRRSLAIASGFGGALAAVSLENVE